MNKVYLSKYGCLFIQSTKQYILRKFSDKVNNKLIYGYRNENTPTSYRIDNRELRKRRQKEYELNIEAENFNAYIKKNREYIIESYQSSSFEEFMRGRKFHGSPSARLYSLLADVFNSHQFDLYPTLKLDRNGKVIEERNTPFKMITDVVIIGGGMVGTSIAYHIKRFLEDDIKVTIIDKDFSYENSATSLSLGGLKQQFGLKENIELSKYAASFLDNVREELSFEGYTPDINLNYSGCLTLVDKEHLNDMQEHYKVLKSNDVDAKLIYKNDLKSYFPWMDVQGIEAGILGMEQEGWFDHAALLDALNRKCAHFGTEYVTGEVVDSDIEHLSTERLSHIRQGNASRTTAVKVKISNGRIVSVPCGLLVLAAGMNTGDVGKIFEIGEIENEDSIFGMKLPISSKKHFIYKIHFPNGPGLNCPVIMDPSGLIIRREGLANIYICQASPPAGMETDAKSMEDYFIDKVYPSLLKISKCFKDYKILKSYPAYSDYNSFDNNPIIGFHLGSTNLFIASGFNNNSVHALGAGNFFMEKILERDPSINLEKFTPSRVWAVRQRYKTFKLVDKSVYNEIDTETS